MCTHPEIGKLIEKQMKNGHFKSIKNYLSSIFDNLEIITQIYEYKTYDKPVYRAFNPVKIDLSQYKYNQIANWPLFTFATSDREAACMLSKQD
jgi:hypothetical protein